MQLGNVQTIHNCCEQPKFIATGEPSFLDKLNKELAKQVYEDEDSLGTQGRIIAKEALHLVDGLKKGYGVTTGWNTPDTLAYQMMEFNLFEFAESKTEARLAAMTDLLIDKEKLQIRSFEDFKKLALKEVSEFNEEWLLAEYNLSISVGQNSAAYQRFMAEKDDFQYVQYQTAGDSNVRSAHAKLDGLIVNLDDKKAMKLFPPNGYGCRCEMIQYNNWEDTFMDVVKVLFVCVHNAARSQMAEAFLNHLGEGAFIAESAGLEKGVLNPVAVKAMEEVGYDISLN